MAPENAPWDARFARSGGRSRRSGPQISPRAIAVVAGLAFIALLYFLGTRGADSDKGNDLQAQVAAAESRAGYPDVIVVADERQVTLSGTVASAADKVAVEAVARSIEDVLSVDNQLEVPGEPSEAAPTTLPSGETAVSDVELQANLNALMTTGVIQFESASAEIDAASIPTLDAIAATLNAAPGPSVEVGGHTDSDGAAEENLTLSRQRAEAVVADLTSRGVDATRLSALGYGDTEPIADNASQEGKAANRRIEFTVGAPAAPPASVPTTSAAPSTTG